MAALRVPGGATLTRKEIDGYTEFVSRYGATRSGLHQGQRRRAAGRDGLQSPILKFLPDEAVAAIMERTGAQTGDLIFFGADKARWSTMRSARCASSSAHDCGMLEDGWPPLWVVDFPMFESRRRGKRWNALHHPFTAPTDGPMPRRWQTRSRQAAVTRL